MNIFPIKEKGFVSFIALVLIIISSLFVFYFIYLTNTNAIGVDVKHSLDRSTKGATATVDEDMRFVGYLKIDADKAKEIFEELINKNLATENKIKLTPIKQHNGKNYVYQYSGFEDLETKESKLDKTPKITLFVFNYEGYEISDDPEDINNFVSFIKNSLEQVSITNSDMDDEIKNGIFAELTGKLLNGSPTRIEGKITDTRSFVLAVAEIPINTFNGRETTMYRFSTARLNSKENQVD